MKQLVVLKKETNFDLSDYFELTVFKLTVQTCNHQNFFYLWADNDLFKQ